MKVVVTFSLDESWDSYKNTNPDIVIEDMFDNWKGKDGVSIDNVKICE